MIRTLEPHDNGFIGNYKQATRNKEGRPAQSKGCIILSLKQPKTLKKYITTKILLLKQLKTLKKYITTKLQHHHHSLSLFRTVPLPPPLSLSYCPSPAFFLSFSYCPSPSLSLSFKLSLFLPLSLFHTVPLPPSLSLSYCPSPSPLSLLTLSQCPGGPWWHTRLPQV